MSTVPPFAPLPDEIPEEREDQQQPDPFGDKTDREGGDPAPDASDAPSGDPSTPSNPA